MSDQRKEPEQLSLPFFIDETVTQSAQVFLFHSRRAKNRSADPRIVDSIPKDKEKKILDKVLERAELLNWYK